MALPMPPNFSWTDLLSTIVSALTGYLVGLFHGKNSNG